MTPVTQQPGDRSRFHLWAVCLALFCGTLLLFSRAVNHDFIDLDDPDYVTENAQVQGGLNWAGARWAFTSSVAANWHPLTLLSHMLDWQVFGKNPRGHHATNVLWHALNAVMAFLMLRRLTGGFWTSAVCAALFAWHPLRVESVAWVAERKDVLSVFFGLLALWAYAAYAEKHRQGSRGAKCFYGVAIAAFATGLLCKPMLVTLPFLMLLLDWWPLQRISDFGFRISDFRRLVTRHVSLLSEKIPFFLLSAVSCVITYLVQKNAGAVVDTLTPGNRLSNAVVSVARYLGKFFWPFDLAIGYPSPAQWPVASVAGAGLLLLAITAVALQQRQQRPWLLTGWFWFLGTLVPVLGLVQVGLQAMADRYTYLPVLGLQLALLWTLREIPLPPPARRLVPVAVALLLAGCAARTWDQLGCWRNPHTLHEHALAVTEGNYLAESYLGTTLLNENRFAEAGVHFRRAIEIKTNFVLAHYRLGVALDKLDQRDQAMAMYQQVLKINPGYGMAHYSLGALWLGQNQPSNAIPHFEAALKIKPDYDPAYVGLGSAMSELGRPQDGIPYFEKALAINPHNPVAHFNCANALADLHRYEQAARHYEQALQLDPDFEEARCNYGNSLRALNRPDEACAQYRRALQLQPKDASAHYGIGAALEDLGKTDEALANYHEAIRLQPDYADAQYNLAAILLNRNQPAEAIPHFLAAVQSQPDYAVAFLGLGLAAAQLGNHREAIGYYERVLAITPDNAEALCCIGVALRRQDKLAEAMPYYEKALRLKPDYAEAHAELGNAYFQTKRPAEAIPHLERALQLHPGFPGLSNILAQARSQPQTKPADNSP